MKILDNTGKEINELDLGIVEAGKTKEYTYTLENDTVAKVVQIKVSIDNKEVEILDFPETLIPKAQGTLMIKWSPSLTVKKGLKTLIKVSGIELYK